MPKQTHNKYQHKRTQRSKTITLRRVIHTLAHYSAIVPDITLEVYMAYTYNGSAVRSGILSSIYSDTPSDILSGIYPDILSDILSGIYSDILTFFLAFYSGIHSDILSGIPSSILIIWHSPWHVFGPQVWPTASGAGDMQLVRDVRVQA